jgi:hypothetical protein
MHPQTATVALEMTAPPSYYQSCGGLLFRYTGTIRILVQETGINVHLQRELVALGAWQTTTLNLTFCCIADLCLAAAGSTPSLKRDINMH